MQIREIPVTHYTIIMVYIHAIIAVKRLLTPVSNLFDLSVKIRHKSSILRILNMLLRTIITQLH